MSWQRVVSLAVLVTGGVAAVALGQVALAAGLFGAAAGMGVPPTFIKKD